MTTNEITIEESENMPIDYNNSITCTSTSKDYVISSPVINSLDNYIDVANTYNYSNMMLESKVNDLKDLVEKLKKQVMLDQLTISNLENRLKKLEEKQ